MVMSLCECEVRLLTRGMVCSHVLLFVKPCILKFAITGGRGKKVQRWTMVEWMILMLDT